MLVKTFQKNKKGQNEGNTDLTWAYPKNKNKNRKKMVPSNTKPLSFDVPTYKAKLACDI